MNRTTGYGCNVQQNMELSQQFEDDVPIYRARQLYKNISIM